MDLKTIVAFSYVALGLFTIVIPTAAFFLVLVASFLMRDSERYLLIYRLAWAFVWGPLGVLALFLAWEAATTWQAQAAGVAIGACLLLSAYACVRRALRRWRLLHDGACADAEVIHLVFFDSHQTSSFARGVRVRYALRGPDGVRREGLSPLIEVERADRLFQRRAVRVCFNPGAPDLHEADVFDVRAGVADKRSDVAGG